jgi:hypothetical protein
MTVFMTVLVVRADGGGGGHCTVSAQAVGLGCLA